MASLVQHVAGLACPPLSGASRRPGAPMRPSALVCGTYVLSKDEKERERMRTLFDEASERCRTAPMEGITFSPEDLESAVETTDIDTDIGSLIKGTVFMTTSNGAFIDIQSKATAFLPIDEACLLDIDNIEEAGIRPGLVEQFMIIDENPNDETLILSLQSIQQDLAWERCRQLQAEDVVITGKVIGGNKGGVVALVEGLKAFVPFSQVSSKTTAEELLDKELPLKFVEVDEEQGRLVLSNRKAMADSQISHDRVADISTVLQPGDTLKVMILSHDRERGRVSLSTKKLEPTPGDMIRNPKLVFEKADEMAQIFRQRIAQAEAMARADMLRFQPESGLSLSSEGILGPLSSDTAQEEGLPADE
ncbi:unnamed protein product [Triticum turgidum subsp. durum]|uniref:S1 motif domain-containing protein n=1 Tax=Triticum turgidum subsp. durum TaxID=4567 RepID=A0A9R0S888_TRITD|nr:unnamed protein product [Triticum turgidum subsp. durum]